MNRYSNSAPKSTWALANSGASLGFKHFSALPDNGRWEEDGFAMRPDGLYGNAEVLANALASGDEEAEATAMALICVLVQDQVVRSLFDQQIGALPKFEAHVNQVLETLVADLEASGP